MSDKNLPATVDQPEANLPAVSGFGATTPAATITQAAEIAGELVTFLKARPRLVVNISGRNYIKCEGWTTTGAMLGTFPETVETKERGDWEEGNYAVRATVAVRTLNRNEVTRADALCSQRETMGGRPRWNDEYAVMSMAQTRATAKAYRQAFSWIIQMAGYEPTPAEEVDGLRDKMEGAKPQGQPQNHSQGGPQPQPPDDFQAPPSDDLEDLPILDLAKMEEVAASNQKLDEETVRKYVWTAACVCADGNIEVAAKIVTQWSSFKTGDGQEVAGPGNPWKERKTGGFVLSPKWLANVFRTAKEEVATYLAEKKARTTTSKLKDDLPKPPPQDSNDDADGDSDQIDELAMLREEVVEAAMIVAFGNKIEASNIVDRWIESLDFPATITIENIKKTRLKMLADHARRMKYEFKQQQKELGV